MPILLILQILSALPGVIKLVRDIVELIHNIHHPAVRAAAEAELTQILHNHHNVKMCADPAGCESDLTALRDKLKSVVSTESHVAPQGA